MLTKSDVAGGDTDAPGVAAYVRQHMPALVDLTDGSDEAIYALVRVHDMMAEKPLLAEIQERISVYRPLGDDHRALTDDGKEYCFWMVYSPQGRTIPRIRYLYHRWALKAVNVLSRKKPDQDFYLLKAQDHLRGGNHTRLIKRKKNDDNRAISGALASDESETASAIADRGHGFDGDREQGGSGEVA